MKHDKLVSVVMPVHNGEKYLREAIESVLKQTYSNFEFLIIENCSTDKSVEIIKSYRDSRIRLIYEMDCGIVQAYNRGFKEAKGKYIVIQDQDDVSMYGRIEKLLKYILKNNYDLCGSSFEIINHVGENIKKISVPKNIEDIVIRIFWDFFSLFNPTIIVKKRMMVELNYWNEKIKIGADYDFILKCLKDYRCGNVQERLLKYRYHKGNTSKKNKKQGEQIVKILALERFEEFQKKFDDPYFILAKLHFFYADYFLSIKNLFYSIVNKGSSKKKFMLMFNLTFFLLPNVLFRKKGLFYNIMINRLINLFRKFSR